MPKKSRNTKQKELVEYEINKLKSFFTAEELFEKVKKKDSRIGLATVYRILKKLRDNHELHSYLCERKTIYSKEEKCHSHFICQKCNKIIHFDIDNINFLKKKIKGNICHFQIDVSGVCEKCLEKNKP